MTSFAEWFTNNPSAFATLASAMVAASVAFLVAVLTQSITSRREQTKFLTVKLEELYLLLNKSAEDNVKRFEAVDMWFHGTIEQKYELETIEDLYGLNHNKRIVLLIRLYFHQLSFIHQQLFHAQCDLNKLYFSLLSGNPIQFEQFIPTSGILGHLLRLIEEEIISNRKKLTGDCWLFCRYKKTPTKELIYTHTPPEGPASTRSQKKR